MAAKKRTKRSGGGAMMGMRSGFKRAVGQKSGRRGRKKEVTFGTVLVWMLVIALILVFAWRMSV